MPVPTEKAAGVYSDIEAGAPQASCSPTRAKFYRFLRLSVSLMAPPSVTSSC